jgi:hypothetical protein
MRPHRNSDALLNFIFSALIRDTFKARKDEQFWKAFKYYYQKVSQSCILKGMSQETEVAAFRGAYGEIKHN